MTLLSADEARALLAGFPAVGAETAPLEAADGRVLAEDVSVPEDLPAWPRAAMDGYAVRAEDTPVAALRVVGSVPMGEVFAGRVGPGEAIAISTGGVLPEGADAVVMVEHTRAEAAGIAVERPLAAGDNVIRPGEDLRRGEALFARGRRLGPRDVGALAALGLMRVPVHRRPRAGILSTGNEVVSPWLTPRPGQIRDVNTLALAASVRRAGAEAVLSGIARDDAAELEERLRELADASDVVLVSGGSSVGARDHTADALERLGAAVLFHGINVRPGKPTILARLDEKPVVGLPGVPVSSLVIFDVFVRPLLAQLAGEVGHEPWPARRRARLTRRVPSAVGREDYLRVRLVDGGAEPLPGGLAMVVRADGLVIVRADRDALTEGEEVDVLLL